MKICCVSDLHGHFPGLGSGDLLIICGDLTAKHSKEEFNDFMGWIDIYEHSYKKIIIIAGNHDQFLQENPDYIDSHGYENIKYLCDSGTELEGLKIWGSPWTKTFPGMNPKCKAFTFDTEEELAEKWVLIPKDTDILVTHSPSFGNFDYTDRKESVGSLSLWMMSLVVKPKLHVFGHIHEAYGQAIHHNGIHFVNCSHVDERYQPVNKPIRIEL